MPSGNRRVVENLTPGRSREILPERLLEGALGAHQQLADFAHRAAPRRRLRNVVHARAHRLGRLARRAGEAAAREHRQVDELVAHVAGLLKREALPGDQLLEDFQFVLNALEHRFDAELGGARRDRGGTPAGKQRAAHAARHQHLEAVAIVRGEAFQLLAAGAVEQGAVGQHAVDVEDHQAHAACALFKAFFQITFARKRSCMFNAPISAPRSSTTSSWLTLCFSMICTASTASASARMVRGPALISCSMRAPLTSTPFSSARRRSPSVKMPRTRCASSTIAVMPMPPRVISDTACMALAPLCTRATSSPRRITSATCTSAWRGSWPRGWLRAKSSAEKPRLSSSATARASPSASAAVVLAVGARLCGQASCATAASRCTSASRASADSGLPVSAISLAPRRFTSGTICSSSSLAPEYEMAMNTSPPSTMPRSPWLASAGWTK